MNKTINICPNCKTVGHKKRRGKYTGTGVLLILAGLLFAPFTGGLTFFITLAGIVFGAIAETFYQCSKCGAEWG